MSLLALVKDGDTHAPEDPGPLVARGVVVGKTVDIVASDVFVQFGDREHGASRSLQPNSKVLHRHFYPDGGLFVPGVDDRKAENAVLDCANGAHSSSGVGRVLEREVAPHLLLCRPLLRWPVPHPVPDHLRILIAVNLPRLRRLVCAQFGLGAFRDGAHSVHTAPLRLVVLLMHVGELAKLHGESGFSKGGVGLFTTVARQRFFCLLL